MSHPLMYTIIIAVQFSSLCEPTRAPGPAGDFNPLYAFKNSMSHKIADIEQEAAILARLGYDGYSHEGLADLKRTLEVLDKHNLKLYNTYFAVNIDSGAQPFDPALADALPLLRGRGFTLWCPVHSTEYKPSDPQGDPNAVRVFQQLADLVAPFDVRVAPYPHIGLWVETPMDTVRLAKKVNRPNFGTSFNLFHWNVLQQEKPSLTDVIKQLVAVGCYGVSLNGPNRLDEGIDIGPLAEDEVGHYAEILTLFRDAGYTGPVGLQCFGINADPRVYLRQSKAVWGQVVERVLEAEAGNKD